jgi:hypothetical protein
MFSNGFTWWERLTLFLAALLAIIEFVTERDYL